MSPRKPHGWAIETAYEYPDHLKESVRSLPSAPGVYIFHAEDDNGVPLYIGKSINIRSRVLSHLRNPDEARLLRQARRISHLCTAGEVGALLLEAQLIKQQQPLHNRRLRRNRQLCSLQLTQGVPNVVYAKDINFAEAGGLYGLFPNKTAAITRLRELADLYQLCYGALGLEKQAKNIACFRFQLKMCAGVCCGKESPEEHAMRLQDALDKLKLITWPYPSAIGLKEQSDTLKQIHVVNNWCYLGSVKTLRQARTLAKVAPAFDSDGYKIVSKAILSDQIEIVLLEQ